MEIYGYVGEMGSGKTHSALQKIKELKSDGKTVLMISWADPMKKILRDNYGLLKSGPAENKTYKEFVNMSSSSFLLSVKSIMLNLLNGPDFKHINITTEAKEVFEENSIKYALRLIQLKKNITQPVNYKECYRNFIQIIGTELSRVLYENIWIELTLNNINKARKYDIADCVLIDDVRFPNEFETLQSLPTSKYNCVIYGVVCSDETRNKRTKLSIEELQKFKLHESEKYVPGIIKQIQSKNIIHNN